MSRNKLSREEILHLAKLTKLHLTDEEIEKLSEQFGETLDYVKNMDELNTSEVEPTSQTTNLENVMFEDGQKNERRLDYNDALKNTKKKKDNMFVVDRIL